jgi:hypothetical protein
MILKVAENVREKFWLAQISHPRLRADTARLKRSLRTSQWRTSVTANYYDLQDKK